MNLYFRVAVLQRFLTRLVTTVTQGHTHRFQAGPVREFGNLAGGEVTILTVFLAAVTVFNLTMTRFAARVESDANNLL
ncbi:hypothetical protein FGL86_08860 [Pistricoccus aurantiacus]|uniref:Uncharacterized protein n=1 Tax=Pistricoccus aurantiacus TaxID=1883414 RepID=A0A5B8SPZ5_9GAMM|nr:hypothetical protein [Pistricoccus aurantiacus]QEA39169.1 hypothetical protein FGL86_08860 [Pistricoccus aurantiacus]